MKNETKEPLRGEKLCKAAVNQILLHPETWYQGTWHSSCRTKHCFAGWCQILSGKPVNENTAARDAQEALEISESEAAFLFRGEATLSEMYYFAENFNRAGYDRAGYDCAGYDCAGYDCDGYNRDGYNRAGYDCDGYDCAGYDCAGYNRAGYNRAGYDRAGYDCAGYDCAGYDCDGKTLTPFEI